MPEPNTATSPRSDLIKWLLMVLLLFAAFAVSWIATVGYVSHQTVERSFVINEDFTKVRKIMVRTNAAKEIITMGGTSEFVDQKWEGGSVQAEGQTIGEALLKSVFSADPGWKLNLEGELKVRTLDDYVGREVITLHQTVRIDPDAIVSHSQMVEGSERLLGYSLTTRLEREGDHTLVNLKLMQAIKTHAPWFAHAIANKRVKASASRSVEKQQAAMIKLIDVNKDQSWLFPLN